MIFYKISKLSLISIFLKILLKKYKVTFFQFFKYFLIKRKLKDNFIFLRVLTTKINEWVKLIAIESLGDSN
jgi:hypothetical protein